ncbi:MAG: hypothetical protein IJX64_06835, partial [Clostridia bacterium]|nr:hypothetical protein [Clostridia bacterium]
QCLLTAAVQNMKKIAMCCWNNITLFMLFFQKYKAYLDFEIGFVSSLTADALHLPFLQFLLPDFWMTTLVSAPFMRVAAKLYYSVSLKT